LTKLDDLSPIQTISIEENQLFTKTLTSLHKREKQYVIGEYFDESKIFQNKPLTYHLGFNYIM